MINELKDKVVLIFGASTGIGKATSLVFAEEGAKLVIADLNAEKGLETVELIRKKGVEAEFIQTDVSEYEEVERAVDFTVEKFGTLDVVYNNAGFVKPVPLLMYTPEVYDKTIKTNQYGIFHGILASSKKMVELGVEGVIVNTSSVFGTIAGAGTFAYNASKGSVNMMVKSAALELAPYNIRVVGVAPGGVDTQFIQPYRDMKVEDKLAELHLRGKNLQPEQIANVVKFLATEASDVINGQVLMLDDGLTSFRSARK